MSCMLSASCEINMAAVLLTDAERSFSTSDYLLVNKSRVVRGDLSCAFYAGTTGDENWGIGWDGFEKG